VASRRRTRVGLFFLLLLVGWHAWITTQGKGRKADSIEAGGQNAAPLREDLPFDQYGGLTNVPCSEGKRPHFYVQKIGRRWSLCTPAGHAFWMLGVYAVADTDTGIDYQGVNLGALLQAKYKTGPTANPTLNMCLSNVRRMQAWGFNCIAEFSLGWSLPVGVHPQWPTSDHTIPVKLPFVTFPYPALYSLSNSGRFAPGPVKDIVAGIKPAVLPGFRANSPDFWDPNFATWLSNSLGKAQWQVQAYRGPHNDYLVGFNVDETDRLFGFGAGPDFPTVANGAKAGSFDQPHLGWMVLVTAPTQSSNRSFNQTYSDTVVYSKQELSHWLASRYHDRIGELNSAWGSAYTAFGSNGGWGKGSGLLDEDGTCPAKSSGERCWVPPDPRRLTGASEKMKQDLDDFLREDARHYFSTVKSALQEKAPGVLYLGPTVLGTWGAPPRRQILEAAADYVDVYMVSGEFLNCINCTDVQERLDFLARYGGDKPWISFALVTANADSYMSPYAKPDQRYKTQAERGQAYARFMQQLLTARDTATGTLHFVGLKWWEFYDKRGEQANFGLVDRRDNPYDGQASRPVAGKDEWGYPTGCLLNFGCEQARYGDFISQVKAANLDALRKLASQQ
jgi:hypothetical protein